MEQQRWQSLFMARVAEQVERYDDVVEAMKQIVTMDVELTSEEMNLLSIGYKNVVDSKRESLGILSSIEKNQTSNENNLKIIKEFKLEIYKEIRDKCEEVISLIDRRLIPYSSTSDESRAMLYKMKGDYYRYIAETKEGDDRMDTADKSLAAYHKAIDIAASKLKPINKVRLGIALNLSVFYAEVLNDLGTAYALAKSTYDYVYDESVKELDDNPIKDEYKESLELFWLIQNNMALWDSKSGKH